MSNEKEWLKETLEDMNILFTHGDLTWDRTEAYMNRALAKGIQQGKREAWKEARTLVESCCPFERMEFYKEGGEMIGQHVQDILCQSLSFLLSIIHLRNRDMTQEKEQWEIEFIDSFKSEDGSFSYIDISGEEVEDHVEGICEHFKGVIADSRSRFKEEVVKALEGMKKPIPDQITITEEVMADIAKGFMIKEQGYNQALQEAIEIIKKL